MYARALGTCMPGRGRDPQPLRGAQGEEEGGEAQGGAGARAGPHSHAAGRRLGAVLSIGSASNHM